ncbi:MAG: SAP domain-containing protein [Deltaproteobacteria bacterium]|nr:SAP domain-containing protein [Deltaproteobacteria bacterium]MBW2645024.1 SAP domain-containing protein [Deltaproteobacteria bacterium]
MKMAEVRAKAKGLGLKMNMKKDDLIRTIQSAEGNVPCFKTAVDYCDQTGCCFRSLCLNEKRK